MTGWSISRLRFRPHVRPGEGPEDRASLTLCPQHDEAMPTATSPIAPATPVKVTQTPSPAAFRLAGVEAGGVKTAFVLGGGGVLGAHEVGMLRALSEAGIAPDVVVGTSVGAINGAFVAADPAVAAERLYWMWQGDAVRQAFSQALLGRAERLAMAG